MTDISAALSALGLTNWTLRGEPTNEAEFAEMYSVTTGTDSSGTAIESTNSADWGTTWAAVAAKRDELVAAEPMRLLREERDRRLAETDWMANSDVTMSSAWTTYRQALRDVPAQEGVTGLDNVTWPTKPS